MLFLLYSFYYYFIIFDGDVMKEKEVLYSKADFNDEDEEILKLVQEKNAIIVLNKIDMLSENDIRRTVISKLFPDAIYVSATTGFGLNNLIETFFEKLAGTEKRYRLPFEKLNLLSQVRQISPVSSEEWLDDCVEFSARLNESGKLYSILEPYILTK